MHLLFGACEFDSGRRVLLRHGRAAPLSLKAFQLLELLLDRRPEAVAKSELLERLWPDTFVSDGSLHNLVAEVRAALGDLPRASRYLRTIPRYGYAFCGQARSAPEGRPASSSKAGARLALGTREWVLLEGPNLVGRDHDCAVRVDSATVSRHHARIVVAGGQVTVEDLESKNGTQVNGQRVERPVALKHGDVIQIGSVAMTYRVPARLPSTLTRRT